MYITTGWGVSASFKTFLAGMFQLSFVQFGNERDHLRDPTFP